MQPDGALKYTIKNIASGQTAELPLYIAAGHSREEAALALEEAKSRSFAQWYEEMERYWAEYLENAAPCPGGSEAVVALYERSLLAMKLMADEETGTIVAAPEFDEHYSRCGGYAYSWGRKKRERLTLPKRNIRSI